MTYDVLAVGPRPEFALWPRFRPMARLPSTLLLEQGVGPAGIGLCQAWLGLVGVVDVIVPAIAITLIDRKLEIQKSIRIGRAQRCRDDRQSLAERSFVDEDEPGPHGPPDANRVIRPMRGAKPGHNGYQPSDRCLSACLRGAPRPDRRSDRRDGRL